MCETGGLEQHEGLVHLYCGDGKGKTTAAVGLSVRAAGAGKAVLFCQFLKGRQTGEIEPLKRLGVRVLRAKSGGKFVSKMTEQEKRELARQHSECLREARELLKDGGFGLAVLDEAVDAVNCGALELEELLAFIRGRPPGTELVLTGRSPDPEIIALAGYYTVFQCRKHPFQRGVAARRGIEY